MTRALSPHILVYKPQTNSVFSLFLRFILLAVFANFIFSVFHFEFLNSLVFGYFLDVTFTTELIVIFYIISYLGEEFIDYDSTAINFLDVDLVIFFNFFFSFSIIFLLTLSIFISSKFIFWTALVAV